jgi:hypothetical protein
MADNSFKQILKYSFTKIKTFLFSKYVFIFLLFFIFSAGLWFVNALGKERERYYLFRLLYNRSASEYCNYNQLPNILSLKIKDEGMNLL